MYPKKVRTKQIQNSACRNTKIKPSRLYNIIADNLDLKLAWESKNNLTTLQPYLRKTPRGGKRIAKRISMQVAVPSSAMFTCFSLEFKRFQLSNYHKHFKNSLPLETYFFVFPFYEISLTSKSSVYIVQRPQHPLEYTTCKVVIWRLAFTSALP